MREKFTQSGNKLANRRQKGKLAEGFAILKKVALSLLKNVQMGSTQITNLSPVRTPMQKITNKKEL